MQVSYAILCLLFFFHNHALSDSDQPSTQFSHDHTYLKNELFGVTPFSTKDENFWGNQSIMTSEAAIEHLSTIETREEDLEEESHINLGIAK